MHQGSIPLYWRLKKEKYNLIGSKCSSCSRLFYPKRPFCPECRRKGKIEEYKFSGKGSILSHTMIRVPPNGFEKFAPYAVAIIKLDEGINVAGQVCSNPEEIRTGQNVRTVFRKMYEDGPGGIIHYSLKWELAEEGMPDK